MQLHPGAPRERAYGDEAAVGPSKVWGLGRGPEVRAEEAEPTRRRSEAKHSISRERREGRHALQSTSQESVTRVKTCTALETPSAAEAGLGGRLWASRIRGGREAAATECGSSVDRPSSRPDGMPWPGGRGGGT